MNDSELFQIREKFEKLNLEFNYLFRFLENIAKKDKIYYDKNKNFIESNNQSKIVFENRINILQKNIEIYEKNIKSLQTEINKKNKDIEELNTVISSYKIKCNNFQKDIKNTKVINEKPHDQILNNLIISFNNWASVNPNDKLPDGFMYIENDIKIRTKQILVKTQKPSKWICNIYGNRIYLLPNPVFFDQMTDISELYKLDFNLLRPKGNNKFKITTPCEIHENGFINYPGKLELL